MSHLVVPGFATLQVEQMVKTDITATAKQLSIVVVRGRAELRHLREQQSRRSASAQWSPGTQSLPSKLVRGASSSASLLGQHPEEVSPQVARIVLHGARILASFSSKTEVNGVIGGVEVTDLTPEGQLFRQVSVVCSSERVHWLHLSACFGDCL